MGKLITAVHLPSKKGSFTRDIKDRKNGVAAVYNGIAGNLNKSIPF